MSGKLFIHIGLPKTATSSLQTDFFPKFNGSNIEYVGVDGHRRAKFATKLYIDFVDCINSGLGIESLKQSLGAMLATGKSLIISEEMIVVSEAGATWKEKLLRLGLIVQDLDYQIILTVREPASAMYSYYGELYKRFSKRYRNFLDCALFDEDMEIYHYKKLTNVLLNSFEVERLIAFKYEDIVSNNFDGLIDVLDPSQVRAPLVTLGHHNLRKSSNGKVETAYVISLVDVLRTFVKMTGVDKLRIFGSLKKVINPIVVFFDSFTLYRAKIEMPNHNDLNILRRSLADDNETLNQVFNISY